MTQAVNLTNVNKDDLKTLKELYNKAPEEGIFIFKGVEIYKGFAYHLIEYLELKLGDL